MSSDPHSGFILAAFALTFVCIAGMTLRIVWDYRSLRRALAQLGDGSTAKKHNGADRP